MSVATSPRLRFVGPSYTRPREYYTTDPWLDVVFRTARTEPLGVFFHMSGSNQSDLFSTFGEFTIPRHHRVSPALLHALRRVLYEEDPA